MILARSSEPRLRGLNILVVEDHQDSRELVTQILLHEGAIVLAAHDGRAALTMLEVRTPDVILADLLMPGMDGFALARQAKADARWAHVPIIAMTALASSADFQATFEAGFVAHVTKPIDWDLLLQTIKRVLPSSPRPAPSPPRRPPPRRE